MTFPTGEKLSAVITQLNAWSCETAYWSSV